MARVCKLQGAGAETGRCNPRVVHILVRERCYLAGTRMLASALESSPVLSRLTRQGCSIDVLLPRLPQCKRLCNTQADAGAVHDCGAHDS